jgi:cytochrome c oxidase subunit II
VREWLGLPVMGSLEAGPVDQTLVLVHWLMLILFAGWTTFFVYVLVRYRRRAERPSRPPDIAPRWATGIEIGVLIAEVALLAVLAVPYWVARTGASPSAPEAVIVRVVAEQFAWNIHYPGNDGRFGPTRTDLVAADNPIGLERTAVDARDDVTTVNELHIPVNRQVVVHLTSKDVVHSFTLPQMRVKQDAIPGSLQTLWFTPTLTGEWEIACSQLCGLAHYRMRGLYTVESQAAFQTWLAARAPAPVRP